MASQRLRTICYQFYLTSISLWIKKGESVFQVGEWISGDTDWPPKKELLKLWSQSTFQDYYQWNATTNIIFMKDFCIVSQGTSSFELEEFFSYVKEHEEWFDVLIDLEIERKKQESFNLLISVAHTIASSLQREDVLDVIIQEAVDAIADADTGFLFLYDETLKKLLVKSAVGFKKESYRKTRLKPGEAISGKVFQTGQAILINGEGPIAKAMEGMSVQNFKHYVESTITRKFPYSVISAPLVFQDQIIGVMTIDCFKEEGQFDENDLDLLKALADHVAVVIEQAKLFQKEKKYSEEIQLTHRALHKEHEQLQRTIDFHNHLTNIATQGKGIDAILDTVYSTVKVPVAVYDSLLKPLSISPGAEDRQLPEQFFKHSAIKMVIQTKKWQKIDLNSTAMIMIVPIIGVGDILGYLCAWIESNEIIEGQSVLLEYAATVLALEWTKEQAIREASERVKGNFFEEVLSGEMNVQLAEQARNLNLIPTDQYAVLLCQQEFSKSKRGTQTFFMDLNRQRLIQQIESILELNHIKALVIQKGIYVMAVLSFSKEIPKVKVRNQIKVLVPKLDTLTESFQIGIGRVYDGLLQLNKSYKDAESCLSLIQENAYKRVLYYADIGVYRFFIQHDYEELGFFVTDILGPLIQYDEKKQGQFLETLLAYVRLDRMLHEVSETLNIHYNTLYYRINRIQEILELSFDDPTDWLNIQLACKVHEYLEKLK